MNWLRLLQTSSVGLLLLAAGCGRKATVETVQVSHPLISPRIVECEPGSPGGRLTLVTSGALRTFNPVLADSDEVTRLIFSPLVELDMATETLKPALAESWTNEPDGRTWTFKLRPGVYWSDGEPLTADDVVFTWNQMIYNPQLNPAIYDIFVIDGKKFSVTKVDDLTVKVVTPEVFAPFLEFFGTMPILPAHAVSAALQAGPLSTVYGMGTPPGRIVGSGPFRVKQTQDNVVLLERNPEYWKVDRKGQRLPYFNEVLIAFTPTGVPAQMFLQGKGDIYDRGVADEYQQFKQAQTNGQFRLVEPGTGLERDFLWFNQNTGTNAAGAPLVPPRLLKWFRNEKFRQAVSCAVDRQRIAQQVYGGHAAPVYNMISVEGSKWANTNVPQFIYDPARARSLLAEIGLQDRKGDGILEDAEGQPVEFSIESNSENQSRAACARFVAEDLKKVGLKVTAKLESFRPLLQRIDTGDYECMLMGLGGASEDPAAQMGLLKSDEPLHQWFPREKAPSTDWEARLDTLMDAQMRTVDFAERKKLFNEVQAILAEQVPMIGTVAVSSFAAVRPDIANLRPSPNTPYHVTWNLEELCFSAKSGL